MKSQFQFAGQTAGKCTARGTHCTHCKACICYCPKESIEYGKKSRGKPQYHFEGLEMQQDL